MKAIPLLFGALLFNPVLPAPAQRIPATAAGEAEERARPTILNAYSTRWDAAHEIVGGNGATTPQRASYVELSDGLNYRDETGTWQRTRPETSPCAARRWLSHTSIQ
ncbi:MAG: hypothetical protein KF833_05530 [Verrucomicrobiae bacterium]|nr:hypothetical protein [Verrucomicrobiae bacterium]